MSFIRTKMILLFILSEILLGLMGATIAQEIEDINIKSLTKEHVKQNIGGGLAQSLDFIFDDSYKMQAVEGWMYMYGEPNLRDGGFFIFIGQNGLADLFHWKYPGWSKMATPPKNDDEALKVIIGLLDNLDRKYEIKKKELMKSYRILFEPSVNDARPRESVVIYLDEKLHYFTYRREISEIKRFPVIKK